MVLLEENVDSARCSGRPSSLFVRGWVDGYGSVWACVDAEAAEIAQTRIHHNNLPFRRRLLRCRVQRIVSQGFGWTRLQTLQTLLSLLRRTLLLIYYNQAFRRRRRRRLRKAEGFFLLLFHLDHQRFFAAGIDSRSLSLMAPFGHLARQTPQPKQRLGMTTAKFS